MREFVVYTGLRIALFLASFGIVFGLWMALADQVPLIWCVALAFVLSGIGSWFLLERPREAFAHRVEQRAGRASAAFEARRAREDLE